MGICGDASSSAKIAALLEIIGLPLFLSGYATSAWMVSETIRDLTDISIGLWKVNDCSSGSCNTYSVPDSFKSGSFVGTQAIESIALVGFVLATVFIVIYVATEKARTRCFAITIMAFGFSSTFFCVVGMIIWLVQLPSTYFGSWSLGLTIIAAALYVVASCLLIKELHEQKQGNILKVEPRKEPIPIPIPLNHYQQPSYFVESPVEMPKYIEKRALPPPSPRYSPITPRTLRSVRVDVYSPVHSDHSRSLRRYGTPKATQRYDYQAR